MAPLGAAADGKLGKTPILDRTVADLRSGLRARLQLQSPVIVSGHQTEFFHAGVFAKNIAVERLSKAHGGSALFLTVDSDQLRHSELIVPQTTSAGIRRVAVPFSDEPRELACEWRRPQPREHWLDFFTRVGSLIDDYDQTLMRPFSTGWLADDDPLDFRTAMTRGVGAVERELGLESARELRISEMSATPEFLAFAAHLLLNAGEFARCYNDAQRGYRQRFRIRSSLKPVPLLETSAERSELPFWLSRAGGPRCRLYASTHGDTIDVYADQELAGRFPRAALLRVDAIGEGWAEPLDGWHIRPRALTLTCFARLFLADLFIHGIGGGRYDAMTDDFTARFFGIDLPPIACVTATMHLALPRSGVDRDAVLAARRAGRDVRFNPQRHLDQIPPEMLNERDELVRRSRSLRETAPGNHAERREVFSAIRATNDRMLDIEPWRAGELDRKAQQLEQEAARDQITLDREYFFALHRKSDMQRLIAEIHESLGLAK
ncbi:MAG: hypothetical protein IID33_02865 [Planctomycetes bacterium]|nr:hypothetical protein [Planctomycetota bacterium]